MLNLNKMMNHQAGSLGGRVFKAGSLVLTGHITAQFIRFGGNLILTRLLLPDMFGVMAVVTVIMAGLAMLSDVGLLQNIVQSSRGEDKNYLNTAWTIQIIRGVLIFIFALIISMGLYSLGQSGYLSSDTVYGNEQLPLILAVISFTSVIVSFNSIYLPLLNRKLMMGRLVIIELVSQMSGLSFMIVWAWYTHDIWALVFGSIITSCVKMILSHTVINGEKCKFFWDREAVFEIFHFGKWIFVSSIFGFLLNQGDRILLGGIMTPEMLGVYTIAFFMANAAKDVLTKLIGSVFFPLLSETFRSAPERLELTYYKIRHKVDIIAFFATGFLYATGEIIIDILYDYRYHDAGWMLQILALSLIGVGHRLSGQCMLAVGKPKLLSVLISVQLVSLYSMVLISNYFLGIEAIIWCIALNPLVRIVTSFWLMNRYLFFNIKKEIICLPFIGVGLLVGELMNRILSGAGIWG